MKTSKPDWYKQWSSAPFKKNMFTLQHIRGIEEQISTRKVKQNPEKRVFVSVITAAFVVLLALFIVNYHSVESLTKKVGAWISDQMSEHDQQPDPIDKPDNPADDPKDYPLIRLKGATCAFTEPGYHWGTYSEFMTDAGTDYELLDVNSGYARIRLEDQTGWVPRWYVANENETEKIIESKPYEMIIQAPAVFSAYPGEEPPTGYVLDKGKVVQIRGEYAGEWLKIEFKTYDGPMTGDKWIRKNELISFNAELAKEGYVESGLKGKYFLDEDGNRKMLINFTTPVIINEEKGNMYKVGAPGGIMDYIYKEDFVPNPFLMQYDITFLGLMPDGKAAYDTFVKTKQDDALQGIEPVDIFKMYYQAKLAEDYDTQYALYMKDKNYGTPPRDMFLKDMNSVDNVAKQNEKQLIQKIAHTEVLQTYLNENEVIIEPVHGSEGEWAFRLFKNEKKIWKVAWMPMQ